MVEDEVAPPSVDSHHPPWERRGTDVARVLSLSDGIFAFAMTLLSLSIALPFVVNPKTESPDLWYQLQGLAPSFQAYVLVFVILASYWRGHNLLFTYLRGWDQPVIQLNMLFLALIVLQPFLVNVIGVYGAYFQAVVLYAGISGLTGLALLGIWVHASRDRRLMHPGMSQEEIDWLWWSFVLTPAIFGASMVIALVSPLAAEVSWLAVFIVQAYRTHGARSRVNRRGAKPMPSSGTGHDGAAPHP